jgi:hypothetical protein
MQALTNGIVGAMALTAFHEGIRHAVPDTPRMDVLGRRAIAKLVRATGQEPPKDDQRQALSASFAALRIRRRAMLAVGSPETPLIRCMVFGST